MRAIFFVLLYTMKFGHFAWQAGWGAWLLLVTWTAFTGGAVGVPLIGSVIEFGYPNFILGLAMLLIGIPLGLTVSHFASMALRLPGAMLLAAIADKPGHGDLSQMIGN